MDGDFRDIDTPRAPRRDTASARRAQPDDAATIVPADLPAYDVRRLMRSGNQAHLVLDGATYMLRITRAGKLILTK